MSGGNIMCKAIGWIEDLDFARGPRGEEPTDTLKELYAKFQDWADKCGSQFASAIEFRYGLLRGAGRKRPLSAATTFYTYRWNHKLAEGSGTHRTGHIRSRPVFLKPRTAKLVAASNLRTSPEIPNNITFPSGVFFLQSW